MRSFLKGFLPWVILGATGIFIVKMLYDHWPEVQTLHLQPQAGVSLGFAIAIAMTTQLWSAVLWGWILALLRNPVPKRWAIVTFLKNAPAKYVPGSIWHFYGRVMAAQSRGIEVESATLSVMLEPLFIIAGALGLSLWHRSTSVPLILILMGILIMVHPIIFNRLWKGWRRLRGEKTSGATLTQYPLSILIGAFCFMGLRSITFLCVIFAFTPIPWKSYKPFLISGFSFAWLLSLVIPSPGGLGVFEAFALQVLNPYFSPAVLLGSVCMYRLVTLCAELMSAIVAHLVQENPWRCCINRTFTNAFSFIRRIKQQRIHSQAYLFTGQ
jgi:glycosyltransferase 2 family protein